MATYKCTKNSNYGKRGDIVNIDTKPEDLTARQKIMLEKYEAPVVKEVKKTSKAK